MAPKREPQFLAHPHGSSDLPNMSRDRPRLNCPERAQVSPPQICKQQRVTTVARCRLPIAQLLEQATVTFKRTHEMIAAPSFQVPLLLPFDQQLLAISLLGAINEESDGCGSPIPTRTPRPLAWNGPWSKPPKMCAKDRVREVGPSCAYLTTSFPGPP